MNVTLDVFSALIDSRAGASPVFDLHRRARALASGR